MYFNISNFFGRTDDWWLVETFKAFGRTWDCKNPWGLAPRPKCHSKSRWIFWCLRCGAMLILRLTKPIIAIQLDIFPQVLLGQCLLLAKAASIIVRTMVWTICIREKYGWRKHSAGLRLFWRMCHLPRLRWRRRPWDFHRGNWSSGCRWRTQRFLAFVRFPLQELGFATSASCYDAIHMKWQVEVNMGHDESFHLFCLWSPQVMW